MEKTGKSLGMTNQDAIQGTQGLPVVLPEFVQGVFLQERQQNEDPKPLVKVRGVVVGKSSGNHQGAKILPNQSPE